MISKSFVFWALAPLITVTMCTPIARAERREYDLVIAQQTVNITGKDRPAMTINGGIPGPTLRFIEGDHAVIRVQNTMNVETSIHWHGLLLPNEMDGVPYITYPPIGPGKTFEYEFDIRQSGTYWYHSHTSLQEQQGVYGSFVIEPGKKGNFDAVRDQVVMLSDWTEENPHTVLHTLKRGGEWYPIRKNSAQSILGAIRLGMLGDYLSRELQRMPPMDLSDVYYDQFLLNGKREEHLNARPGERIRLRVIDGSASSFFYLEFSGGPLKIISADGQLVEPVDIERFLIGVAETYDVLVTVPSAGSYEFRATAQDGSGHTSLWIGDGHQFLAKDVPLPNLYKTMGGLSLSSVFVLTPSESVGMTPRDVEMGKFDKPGMNGKQGMDKMQMNTAPVSAASPRGQGMESTMAGMNNSGDKMQGMGASDSQMSGMKDAASSTPSHSGQSEAMDEKRPGTWLGLLANDLSSRGPLMEDGMNEERPWAPYDKLRSLKSTSFNPIRPVREVRLTLDGDMERFVWFINDKPLSESDSIAIHKGELVRFIMINQTMMHHPMHLHGHFFRVINGQGDYSPLKHTVDVAPMSTTVIEFNADEFGDWFFHCHLLYHMESGMARVVHYDGFQLNPAMTAERPKLYTDEFYLFGELDAMSQMSQGLMTLSNSRNIFSAEGKVGWGNVDKVGWEFTPTYDYYLNRFSSVFSGVDLQGVGGIDKNVGIFGARYLLPLNIRSRSWVDTDGAFQFALGRRLDLTPRLKPFAEFEFDTKDRWEIRSGISYILNRDISLIGQWHSDFGWGAGLQVRF